ncbi:alkyl hydroperoxide reductase AhpD [Aliidongia dinghuensis]|uniref:Alkyl hydroperoxide reductase AhpD n=1 Tax=Aliidongia dinghuensis TaxID=1867774 RepID=A0A8J2YZG3_9PROT|nr:carboxymuconolactone decarboxylase family protein [Aliidongia dinghuensis]GGF45379.1 alkyl hydroperoxide reductase AhpD [Aliidongia dinghuensis]
MSIDSLKAALPDYAKDLKLNIGSVLTSPGLTEQQIWGTAVASAIAARNDVVRDAILAEATAKLSPEALNAAKAAAAIMGMNNIYYRFVHLASAADYKTMPAKLRMNVIANPGVDAVDFELWSLAVSAINGCGMCIDAHEHEIVKKGATREAIQNVVRIASVIHAIAVTLEGERAQAA